MFTLFDDTYFTGSPKPLPGFLPITQSGREMYRQLGVNVYDMTRGDELATRALARKARDAGTMLVLDIEHWPTDIRKASQAEVDESLGKFAEILRWIKDEVPGLHVGLYRLMVHRDYWTPVNYRMALELAESSPWWRGNLSEFTDAFVAWQRANDQFAPLLPLLDFFAPSLYTFYDDWSGWEFYARETVAECRRLDASKPVYPYLWMYYHDSNKTLAGQTIDAGYWVHQLQTLKMAGADGAVLWGGWQRPWDEKAEWWRATQEFMGTLKPQETTMVYELPAGLPDSDTLPKEWGWIGDWGIRNGRVVPLAAKPINCVAVVDAGTNAASVEATIHKGEHYMGLVCRGSRHGLGTSYHFNYCLFALEGTGLHSKGELYRMVDGQPYSLGVSVAIQPVPGDRFKFAIDAGHLWRVWHNDVLIMSAVDAFNSKRGTACGVRTYNAGPDQCQYSDITIEAL